MHLPRRTLPILALPLVLAATGCMRRDGRNSDCRWPGETPVHAADDAHLSADAEFAEDLAIRYADRHDGLRTPNFVSGEAYEKARDACRDALFREVATTHGVSAERVAGLLGKNRGSFDVAINLPFVLFCCLAAMIATRMIWKKYPVSENGWMPPLLMMLFVSIVFAVGAALMGEVWSWIIESWRVGNGHMSFRVERLPWHRYRPAFMLGAAVLFWLMAAAAKLLADSARHRRYS